MKKLFCLIVVGLSVLIFSDCYSFTDKKKIKEQFTEDCNYSENLKIIKIEKLNNYQLPQTTPIMFGISHLSKLGADLSSRACDCYVDKRITKKELVNIIDSIKKDIDENESVMKLEEICFLWDGTLDILHEDTIIPVIDGSRNYKLTVTDGHKEAITYAKVLKDGSVETGIGLSQLLQEYLDKRSDLWDDMLEYEFDY